MRSTLGVYARIVVSIGNEGHKSSSALAVTIITLEVAECRLIFLGGRWPDELGSLIIRGQPRTMLMRMMTIFLVDLSSLMMKTSSLTLIRSPRMSVFDRHFQRTGHGRQSFRVGHSLRISRITLNRNILPFGVNMSRQGRSMWTMNVTSD
jgi:hypothetical protein